MWTGTLGVLELPVNSSRVELYLVEKDGNKYIPVPAYFWKVRTRTDQFLRTVQGFQFVFVS